MSVFTDEWLQQRLPDGRKVWVAFAEAELEGRRRVDVAYESFAEQHLRVKPVEITAEQRAAIAESEHAARVLAAADEGRRRELAAVDEEADELWETWAAFSGVAA